MKQETINTVYDKLDQLREAFEAYIAEHDTAEAELTLKAVITHIDCSILSMKD